MWLAWPVANSTGATAAGFEIAAIFIFRVRVPFE